MKAMVLFGTRPEIIKLAPVIQQLERQPGCGAPVIVSTGQHREFTDQMTAFFDIAPHYDLDVMQPQQTLAYVTGAIIQRLDPVIASEAPDVLIVQGDTMSSTAGAIVASLRRVRVAHVEAGLRTPDKFVPFPEEINRRLNSAIADWHFAPTDWTRRNLVREGKDPASIHVTGNTVIDALHTILARDDREALPIPKLTEKEILLTLHRRESLDGRMGPICYAVREIVEDHPDASVVFPLHRNPRVRETVVSVLRGHPRIQLVEPLPYAQFIRLLSRCHMVMTDSGGLQEEGPALAKPVLVLRDVTERPEAVEAGVARLVGTDPRAVIGAAAELLGEPAAHLRMSRGEQVFGDGRASERIVGVLLRDLEGYPYMIEEEANAATQP